MHDYQLLTFVGAATLGSFSSRAKEEHIAVQAVALRMKTLEQELNVKLFERTAQGVTLTPAGVDFRETAENVLELLDEGKKRAQEIAQRSREIVRFGIAWKIPPLFQKFLLSYLDRNPHISFVYPESEADTFVEDLLRKRVDMVVQPTSSASVAGIGSRYFIDSPLVCTFRPQSKFAEYEQIDPRKLKGCKVFSGFDYHAISSLRFVKEQFPESCVLDKPVPGESLLMGCLESDENAALFTENTAALVCPPLVHRPVAGCPPISFDIYYRLPLEEKVESVISYFVEQASLELLRHT